MPSRRKNTLLYGIIVLSTAANAINLNIGDNESIKQAASTIAYGLMKYYTGNQTSNSASVGFFPAPYYWWEAGAAWGGLIEYWHYTNDTSYNNVVSQALLSQASPTNDFMPVDVQNQEGNDDQSFWGFAAMSAVEHQFPNPPSSSPQWLALAEGVFNSQVARWDTTSCNGGLKWQIFPSNTGYDYKNSVANGAFFQLSARLARYTGNQTYVDWAEKSWDWMSAIGLLDAKYHVYDGTDDTSNCSVINKIEWTYTTGMVLYGSAVLTNYTNGSSIWMDRTIGILESTVDYFTPYTNASFIMYEPGCEKIGTCDTDQLSFKAYLSRWMAAASQMVPSLAEAVMTLLRSSAVGAAKSCSGGTDNVTCGQKWYIGGWDGTFGVGQQLSALEVIQVLLVDSASPPVVAAGVHIANETVTTSVAVPTKTSVPLPTTTSTVISTTSVSGQTQKIGIFSASPTNSKNGATKRITFCKKILGLSVLVGAASAATFL